MAKVFGKGSRPSSWTGSSTEKTLEEKKSAAGIFMRTITGANPEQKLIFSGGGRGSLALVDKMDKTQSNPHNLQIKILDNVKILVELCSEYDSEEIAQVKQVFDVLLNKKKDENFFEDLLKDNTLISNQTYYASLIDLQAKGLAGEYISRLKKMLCIYSYFFDGCKGKILEGILNVPNFLLDCEKYEPRVLNDHQKCLKEMIKSVLSSEECQHRFCDFQGMRESLDKKKEILEEKPKENEAMTSEQENLSSRLQTQAKFLGPLPLLFNWVQVIKDNHKTIEKELGKRPAKKNKDKAVAKFKNRLKRLEERLELIREIFKEDTCNLGPNAKYEVEINKILRFFDRYNDVVTLPFINKYKEKKADSPGSARKIRRKLSDKLKYEPNKSPKPELKSPASGKKLKA